MQQIEIGDLTLNNNKASKQDRLFHAIREKIVHGFWAKGGKLPSTRHLAEELSLSRNTVISTYEQLVAEGYVESRQGSGFYIAIELPEQFLPAQPSCSSSFHNQQTEKINVPFAPGVPDLAHFPHTKWQRILQRHLSRQTLFGNQNIQGDSNLRYALSHYLSSSRSVACNPDRIIITSGAQQALCIAAMATLTKPDPILMEQPGYTQMRKVISLLGLEYIPVQVKEYTGLDLKTVLKSDAKALYITPSNQYPMGTTLDTRQRLTLIEWAAAGNRWIIEDDYDSEFQFAHRPYTSLQGLADQMGHGDCIIYVGSFSKTMFNGLRIGYLVVPESIIPTCLQIKDALSGDSPTHTQAALADFILEGDLIRHIRKMRRLYKSKHQYILSAIESIFGERVEVISQAAGLHITLKWYGGIDEETWVAHAKDAGILIRPLSYYEKKSIQKRDWNGIVLGYGNTNMDEIEPNIQVLAHLFDT